MLVRQFLDDDLGCASYLVADEAALEAVLVDPPYAVAPLLASIDTDGLRLLRVLETHTHADHLSGHGRLALDVGAPVAIHRGAGAAYPHEPLDDGTEIAVGSIAVRTIHTPGHRPEHCCFLAGDALFTGDSLFVGTAARPDLAVEAREGAEGLFHSLHRLLELPDDVRVMPGHVAGSLCGAGMSAERSSTIGQERRFNPVLALATVEDFVAESTAAVATPRPPNMERIVDLNRGPFVGAAPPVGPVEANGYFVLDVRDAFAHAAAHVAGAVNVPVDGGSFGTKAGFLIPGGAKVALHADSPAQANEAAARLHAVGFIEEIAGYLAHPEPTESTEPVGMDELRRLVESDRAEVIDVREAYERDGGYIPGSRHIPYRMVGEFAADLATDRVIVTVCETGPRAGVAASVLRAAGVPARPVLHGGINEWLARGGQVTRFRRCGGSC